MPSKRTRRAARAAKRGEPADPLYTLQEAATAAGSPLRRAVSVYALRDLVRAGELPVVRLGPNGGGRVLVLRGELRAFIARGGARGAGPRGGFARGAGPVASDSDRSDAE